MLDTQRAAVYGGWSAAPMYQQQGPYPDGNMMLFEYNMQNSWEADQYYYQYENDPNHYPAMCNERDESKYLPPDPLVIEQPVLTAVGKPSAFADEVFYNKWDDGKPMRQWSPDEVFMWLCEQARKQGYDYEKICLTNFQGVNGDTLLRMTEHDFMEKDRNVGFLLYNTVQGYIRDQELRGRLSSDIPNFYDVRGDEFETKVIADLSCPNKSVPSDVDSDVSESSFVDVKDIKTVNPVSKSPPPVRKVGRPPKMGRTKRGNKEKKCGRLWEFIRDLLKKPEYCPSLICWENHDEGVFRFVRSDKVAQLWGDIKENPKMTYEKLSRAMRYYYKSKVLQPVLGRRLVYKFGPTARDWRSADPNFRNSSKKAHDACI